jgi:hypothetical protein
MGSLSDVFAEKDRASAMALLSVGPLIGQYSSYGLTPSRSLICFRSCHWSHSRRICSRENRSQVDFHNHFYCLRRGGNCGTTTPSWNICARHQAKASPTHARLREGSRGSPGSLRTTDGLLYDMAQSYSSVYPLVPELCLFPSKSLHGLVSLPPLSSSSGLD